MLKGNKTKYIREAITNLSTNGPVTLSRVKEYIKSKYGFQASQIGDSTFYTLRKTIVMPTVSSLVEPKQENGIASLVRQLKEVVAKVGSKDETKQIIDVL